MESPATTAEDEGSFRAVQRKHQSVFTRKSAECSAFLSFHSSICLLERDGDESDKITVTVTKVSDKQIRYPVGKISYKMKRSHHVTSSHREEET
ncbi:unnamed protein product [Onchocerca flexuosa]|uniref:MSP domain-containing protein n=1 Tax=Onchocerca flexuosa TaxID=387005 RepID=A0A183I3U6_9BILA|nr:unnamed protein product [Onchocerca flexuosa]